MASIDIRKRQHGDMHRVRWREAGEPASEEFADPIDAALFRALVEAGGNTYPAPVTLHARGFAALAAKRERELNAPRDNGTQLIAWCRDFVRTESQANDQEKQRYLRMIENHLLTYFGEIRIGAVTPRMIRDWQDHMADESAGPGASPKTIKNVRCAVLAPALAAAARPDLDGNPPLIPFNPCLSVRAPKVDSERPEVWTQKEVVAMLKAAERVDPDAYSLLATLAGTGMRWSEAIAITSHAVYPDRGLVEVRRVAHKTAGGWELREGPKTRNGYRTVAAAPAVLRLLGDQAAPDGALVLTPGGRGELWVYDAFFRNQWEKVRAAVRAAGFTRHLTLHGLRHTAATRMAEGGVDLYTLSSQLGHKPGTTVALYGGRTGNRDRQAAAALGTLVGTSAA